MFRKLLIVVILLGNIPIASALSVYLAPMALYQGIKAGSVEYEGVLPQLALGVGGTIKDYPIYLGGEAFVNIKPITIHNHRGQTLGLKPNYSGGLSFIPGVCLDDQVLLYGRLGALVTSFQDLDLSKHGYQAGIGIVAKLTKSWDVRGEYVYTKYTTIVGIGAPRMDQFGVGLIYQFT